MSEAGVQKPRVIDVITHDPKTDTFVLIMVEDRPWSSSPKQLLELQEKINRYLVFALDGEMWRKLPGSKGKAIRLQLDCATEPDANGWTFIDLVREKLKQENVEFVVNLL